MAKSKSKSKSSPSNPYAPLCTMRLALTPAEVALMLDALLAALNRCQQLHDDAWHGLGGDPAHCGWLLLRADHYRALLQRFQSSAEDRRRHQCDDPTCLCHGGD